MPVGHEAQEEDTVTVEPNMRTRSRESGPLAVPPVPYRNLVELLQATPDFVAILSPAGETLFLSTGARTMLGLRAPADGLGFDIPEEARWAGYRCPAWARRKLLEEALPAACAHGLWTGETALYDARGREIQTSHTVLAHYDADGRLVRYSEIIRDITDLVAARDRLVALAYTDHRTDLPNREAFRNHVDSLLADAPAGQVSAVLVIELERFQELLYNFGRDFADRVLRATAARLAATLDDDTYLAQVSGTEFAAVLPTVAGPKAAERAAQAVDAALRAPLTVDGAALQRHAHIGIAIAPQHGTTTEELLRQGKMARDWGPARPSTNYRFADPQVADAARERLNLTEALKAALAADELQVHYQPLVNPCTGALVGLEALARWYEPERGWVSPGTFIPLAESAGLIERVGAAVRGRVLADLGRWRAAGRLPPRVSVNLAVPELRDPVLPSRLLGALRDHNLEPALLELEVTESQLAESSSTARDVLAQLRFAGVAVAVDDFGSGYSALAQISRLPADRLKLDQAFVRDVHDNRTNQAILTAVHSLAAGFGLSLLTEGVESEAERAYLAEQAVSECQGFYFGKPQDRAAVEAWLTP